jgi:non-heme chloroperoxidase
MWPRVCDRAIDGFVDVPDGYLHYRQRGQGPDVVLVNGGGVDLRMWDSTVVWLADIARVTTWDCRDTGLSSASDEPYDEIEDLAAVLDAAGVARATLVGVSIGGRQVLAFAHRHPDRVAKACVVGGSFNEFPDPSEQESAAWQTMLVQFAEREKLLRGSGSYAAAAWDADGWSPALSPDDRRRMIGWQVANDRIMYLEEYNGVELDPPVKTRFAEIAVPRRGLLRRPRLRGYPAVGPAIGEPGPPGHPVRGPGVRPLPDAVHARALRALHPR